MTSLTHGFEAERRERPLRLGNQLNILKQGVQVWNAWRARNLDVQINLSRADLRGANINNAHLNGANLSNAHLNGANLSYASLTSANLSRADLSNAHLRSIDLAGANLSGADLSFTDLSHANLSNAHLSGTHPGYTVFGDVDLSTVKGLETMKHRGPSTIGIDTIILSQGKIPEIFLRSAGVPDSIIEAIPSLVGSLNPIDYYSCFISYSSRPKMRERVTRGKVASQPFRCTSARTTFEATPLQSTQRRKPVADTAFCYEWSNGNSVLLSEQYKF